MTCTQNGCKADAVSWVLWPTGKELYLCLEHSLSLGKVCRAMGWTVQFNVIVPDPAPDLREEARGAHA